MEHTKRIATPRLDCWLNSRKATNTIVVHLEKLSGKHVPVDLTRLTRELVPDSDPASRLHLFYRDSPRSLFAWHLNQAVSHARRDRILGKQGKFLWTHFFFAV